MRLKGKTCAVVGGATGWGRAVAQRAASEGAAVIVLDTDAAPVAETLALIEGAGGRATGHVVDTTNETALAGIAAGHPAEFANLSGLVTHYMAMDWHSFEDSTVAEFSRVVQTNLIGPVAATKAFLPHLKAAAGAAIVHIGSVDGLNGNPRVPSYSAAKGGLVPLTHVTAFEFAPYDIRVNLIATAQTVQMTEDEMRDQARLGFPGFPGVDYMRQLNRATPLKRHGPLTDWAGTAAFLLSDDADYVTGSVIVVDCGRIAITPGTA